MLYEIANMFIYKNKFYRFNLTIFYLSIDVANLLPIDSI